MGLRLTKPGLTSSTHVPDVHILLKWVLKMRRKFPHSIVFCKAKKARGVLKNRGVKSLEHGLGRIRHPRFRDIFYALNSLDSHL